MFIVFAVQVLYFLLNLFLNTSFVNILDGMICFLFGESMFIKTGDNETRASMPRIVFLIPFLEFSLLVYKNN